MPYVVTTKRDKTNCTCNQPGAYCHCTGMVVQSRRAVATLEEATKATHAIIGDGRYAAGAHIDSERWAAFHNVVVRLPESGGTVGPLPDATVIEVERVGWLTLAHRAGHLFASGDQRSPTRCAETIAAFNAREVSGDA